VADGAGATAGNTRRERRTGPLPDAHARCTVRMLATVFAAAADGGRSGAVDDP
jgi:hypothetical protein